MAFKYYHYVTYEYVGSDTMNKGVIRTVLESNTNFDIEKYLYEEQIKLGIKTILFNIQVTRINKKLYDLYS